MRQIKGKTQKKSMEGLFRKRHATALNNYDYKALPNEAWNYTSGFVGLVEARTSSLNWNGHWNPGRPRGEKPVGLFKEREWISQTKEGEDMRK